MGSLFLIITNADLLVQVGIRHEVRRVNAMSNIARHLKNEDIYFEAICKYLEESPDNEPLLEKVGRLNE